MKHFAEDYLFISKSRIRQFLALNVSGENNDLGCEVWHRGP
jgi:hypothetical protein